MSVFTLCPACGSDWCSSCSCVKEQRDMWHKIADERSVEIIRLKAIIKQAYESPTESVFNILLDSIQHENT